ncbi:Uncharacterised protein [Legionella sainthelensi]|nr:Uncharacterised protein [Legionella sainthelensi]
MRVIKSTGRTSFHPCLYVQAFPFKKAPEQIEYPTFSAHTLIVDKKDWALFKQKASDYQVSYSSVLLSLYGSVLAYFSGHKEFLITPHAVLIVMPFMMRLMRFGAILLQRIYFTLKI